MVLLIIAVSLFIAGTALWILPRNSRLLWKLLGRVAGTLFLCASPLIFLLFLIDMSGMCGRYDFPQKSSRDGAYAARVSEEDCGAVDSFHSSVEIWRMRQGVFARIFGKQGHSTTVFTIGNDPRLIDLQWKDDHTLFIRYPKDSSDGAEFSCMSQSGAIHIDCVAYKPDYNKPVGEMPTPHHIW